MKEKCNILPPVTHKYHKFGIPLNLYPKWLQSLQSLKSAAKSDRNRLQERKMIQVFYKQKHYDFSKKNKWFYN